MSADRDIERLLDTWFADGPMQVSDHAFDEAVGRVHRQRQRPAWRVSWRDPTVSAYLKPILAIAAVIVLAVGGVAFIARPTGSGVGGVASRALFAIHGPIGFAIHVPIGERRVPAVVHERE